MIVKRGLQADGWDFVIRSFTYIFDSHAHRISLRFPSSRKKQSWSQSKQSLSQLETEPKQRALQNEKKRLPFCSST